MLSTVRRRRLLCGIILKFPPPKTTADERGPASGEDARCLKIFSSWRVTYAKGRSIRKVGPVLSLLLPLAGCNVGSELGLLKGAQQPNIFRHLKVQMLLGIKNWLWCRPCNKGPNVFHRYILPINLDVSYHYGFQFLHGLEQSCPCLVVVARGHR